MQQPSSGSLLPLELAKGEPAAGGLDFDTAIREWVSEEEWRRQRSEIEFAGGLGWILMERDSEAEIERECRSRIFNKKWEQREIVSFGFPLHKKRAGRRELISAELRETLRFGGYGPGPKIAGFTCDYEWDDSDHRRGVAYSNVRFYPHVASAPAGGVTVAQPAEAPQASGSADTLREPSPTPKPQVRQKRTDEEILIAATRIFDGHEKRKVKPPNVDELWSLIRRELPGVDKDQANCVFRLPVLRSRRLGRGKKFRPD